MTDLTDQQKSALLMKAMGWILGEPHRHGMWTHVSVYGPSGTAVDSQIHPVIAFTDGKVLLDLYDPANMALAKRVVLWAYANDLSGFIMWLEKYALAVLIDEYGFRKVLDKILDLALGAGIVEVQDE